MTDHERLRVLLIEAESHVSGLVAVPGPESARIALRRRVRRRAVATGLCGLVVAIALGLAAWAGPNDVPTDQPSPSPSAMPTPSAEATPTSTLAVGVPCTSTFYMSGAGTHNAPEVWLGLIGPAAICPGTQLKVSWALYRLEGDTRRLVTSKSYFIDQGTQSVRATLPGAFCGDALVVFVVGDLGPVSSFSDSAMRGGKLPYSLWSAGKAQGMWDFSYAVTPCPSPSP